MPSSSARTRASVTTGPSDVPPDTIVTSPRASGTSRATQASRARASSSASGATRAQRRPRVVVGARHQHAARAALEQGARDRLDLVRRLALGEDRLRRALALLAVGVHAREAEIAEGLAHGGSASATTGSVRCRHAATAGHRHARAQAARRAVALRPRPRARPAGASAGGQGPLAGAARCPCRPATTTSSPTPRCATTSATSGTSARARARAAGRASGSCCASTPPPTARSSGSTTPRSPSTRAATRRSRPTSPSSSQPGAEHRITVVVNNVLSWQSIPPGVVEEHAGRPPPALLPRLLQLRRPAPVGLAVHHAARRTSSDVTVVTGLDGSTGTVALRGRGRGRRRSRCASRCATPAAPRSRGRPAPRASSTVADVQPWRPGEGYLYELDVELWATATRWSTLLAAGRHPHRRGRRHALPDQRRAVLLHRLRQARGQRGARQGPRRRVHGPRLRAAGVDRRELVPHLALPLRRGGARLRRPARHRRHRRDRRGRAQHGPRRRHLRHAGRCRRSPRRRQRRHAGGAPPGDPRARSRATRTTRAS